ncbi:MAG: phosphogluconate dehydrogenase C-terminal domain-containing protein [Actinomycetales bacterium]
MTDNATATHTLTLAVVGAGGKMGMRVSNNLATTSHDVRYVESSPSGQQRTREAGREVSDLENAIDGADIVILAVPDIALKPVTEQVVPHLAAGTVVLTLDPAAAYANQLFPRDDIHYAVAHPCHPSIFLRRTTEAEYADTFGGIAAPQDVVAAFEDDEPAKQAMTEEVIRAMYAPVIDVHWVTVKQLAQCEPTLVETIACMIGEFLKESLNEAVNTMGVPEPAARSILLGHTQVALANALQGDNPFSDACMIAMRYGRDKLIKDDWKVIFRDDELDKNLQAMLHLDAPITR